MTMRLEALIASTSEPPLAEYRSLLRSAAESGVTVDDPSCAEAFAALAKRLGYSAGAVRADHETMRRCVILERRFDPAALVKDQRKLERLRRPDDLYHRVGGELETELRKLKCKLDAARDDDRPEILAAMEAAKERGRELTRPKRVIEGHVISGLNAADRLAGFRRANRRLFPDADD